MITDEKVQVQQEGEERKWQKNVNWCRCEGVRGEAGLELGLYFYSPSQVASFSSALMPFFMNF